MTCWSLPAACLLVVIAAACSCSGVAPAGRDPDASGSFGTSSGSSDGGPDASGPSTSGFTDYRGGPETGGSGAPSSGSQSGRDASVDPGGAHGGTDAGGADTAPPGWTGGNAVPGIGGCLNGSGGCTEYLPGDEPILAAAQAACTTNHGTWTSACPRGTTKGCKYPPGSGSLTAPAGYIAWSYSPTVGAFDQCVDSVNIKADIGSPTAPPAGISCVPKGKIGGSCAKSSQGMPFVCTAYYAADITTILASCSVGVFSTGGCPSGAKGHCVSPYETASSQTISYFYQTDLSADCTGGAGLWCP